MLRRSRRPPAAGSTVDLDSWVCPVCGGSAGRPRWRVDGAGSEGGVEASAFRPSSDRFGSTAATVVTCGGCGHGSLASVPNSAAVAEAYGDAADPISLREETGQVATATRALTGIERVLSPGSLLDIGCWTGSFLVAARQRGWQTAGVEPSRWAALRAAERGLDVQRTEFSEADLQEHSYRLVVMCDVLEHLADPGAAIERAGRAIEAGGGLYVTVPDAGSMLARAMGRRWWSVLPMHLQYFTRSSLSRLLTERGFAVRSISTHAKVFTMRYYAERIGGYSPGLEGLASRALQLTGTTERLVAPDFHDRVAMLAIR